MAGFPARLQCPCRALSKCRRSQSAALPLSSVSRYSQSIRGSHHFNQRREVPYLAQLQLPAQSPKLLIPQNRFFARILQATIKKALRFVYFLFAQQTTCLPLRAKCDRFWGVSSLGDCAGNRNCASSTRR
eukprot:9504158-Pyramimonas_sp.AAC.1